MTLLYTILGNPIYVILTAILYFKIGYQMAKIKMELFQKWNISGNNTLGIWPALRFFYFPYNYFVKTLHPPTYSFFLVKMAVSDSDKRFGYMVVNMAFWPLQIVWFAVILVDFFIFFPIGSFLVAIVWRTAKDTFFAISRLVDGPEPIEQPTQDN